MKKAIPDPEEDFALIGRFFDFALTEPELKEFEVRMEKDTVLQERFRIYEEMEQHIDQSMLSAKAQDSTMETFKTRLKPEKENGTTRIIPLLSRRFLALAAAVTLLVIGGIWWLNSATTFRSGEALAGYYWDHTDKDHLFDSTLRGEEDRDPNEAARAFFRSIRDFQQKGEYGTMIDQLEIYKVTTPAPIPFEDDADWLLAVAYLANEDLEKAVSQLELIRETSPLREEKVQQMLEDIRKLEAEGAVRR